MWLFPAYVVSPVYAGQLDKSKLAPTVPYNNAMQAFGRGGMDEARRWLDVTAEDFAAEPSGQKAGVLIALLTVAHELGYLNLARYTRESLSLELDKPAQWKTLAKKYEERALDHGLRLARLSPTLTQFRKDTKLAFDIPFSTSALDAKDLRRRFRKGQMLDVVSMQRLEEAEIASSFVGLLSEILLLGDKALLNPPYKGTLVVSSFYRVLGVRLFIVADRRGDKTIATQSRSFFEKVMQFTQDSPYHQDRMKAKDFLTQLDLRRAKPTKTIKPKKGTRSP